MVHFLTTFFKKCAKKDFESLYDFPEIGDPGRPKMAEIAFRISEPVLTRLCFFVVDCI